MPAYPYLKTGFLGFISVTIVSSIILFPQDAFESSLRGLTIWWEVVFPALLPFFIAAELLMGFGVVHFLGVLLEPLMRPLFRIPGVGGFVLSMSLASGNPMGAKLSARLREQDLITQVEGERLVSIAGTSGPLFMFGAVAVGFFHDARLGIVIALSHYIGAFCVGLIMRFHGHHQLTASSAPVSKKRTEPILYRALKAMHQARIKDSRAIGALMGDAVSSSIQTLLLIGGFIITFSVLINIMSLIGIHYMISMFLTSILNPLGINLALISPIIAGFLEMTLGAQAASDVQHSVPMAYKVAIASAIISWSGLSIHAQVASMLATTDIRYAPFLLARFVHAGLAFIWALLLWNPIQSWLSNPETTLGAVGLDSNGIIWDQYMYFLFAMVGISILLFLIIILVKTASSLHRTKLLP